MNDLPDADTNSTNDLPAEAIEKLINELVTNRYRIWQEEQLYRNVLADDDVRPGHRPESDTHRITALRQCRRKRWYERYDAPREQSEPHHITWPADDEIIDQYVQPFLAQLASEIGTDAYVKPSMWVEVTVTEPEDSTESDSAGDHKTSYILTGESGPTVVNNQGVPLLPTIVRRTRLFDAIEFDDPQPAPHDLAALHAIMYGLSDSFERAITTGVVIYMDESSADAPPRAVPVIVDFDIGKWIQVLDWVAEQTDDYVHDSLPPAGPIHPYECQDCPYAVRCGVGPDPPEQSDDVAYSDTPWEDTEATGFIPGYQYPFPSVVHYLRAFAPKGAMITPTIAANYPTLQPKYQTTAWYCPQCSTTYQPWQFQWDGNESNRPICRQCDTALIAPPPEHQPPDD